MDMELAQPDSIAREDNHQRSLAGRDQQLRKRRLAMAFASYLVTFTLVTFCWRQGLIPGLIVLHYAVFALLNNALFFGLIQSNLNLRFKDPSMTSVQIVTSLLPALWVMFFLAAGQARAAFLLIAIVPALYGILALNTRQFVIVGIWMFALYSALYGALWLFKPQVLTGALDLIQSLGYLLVLAQTTIIGGFISGLRGKLRDRNRELKQAMERIQELVNVDALTGVYNRRRLFEVISEESNRHSRNPGSFCVCILDVDHFKAVNDNHGHQAGDCILRSVAQSVAKDLREIDCFGRYGGEEFLIVLPQTPLSGARIKAERVRASIETLRFPDLPDTFNITVSIGIAEYQPGESTDDTLARADQALYNAKHGGRNRVMARELNAE